MSINKQSLKVWALDIAAILIGGMLFAVAIDVFTLPNRIAPGGATGVATVLNYMFKFNVGILIILLNIPLFVISYKQLGGIFFVKTAIATFVTSIEIDIFAFLPNYTDDRLLASIFGAVIGGTGLSFIYMRGIMTGGSDLLAQLIKKRFPHMTIGRLILMVDAGVISFATLVFREITSALYAVLFIFISSKVIDSLLGGLDMAKVIYIISDKSEEISEKIIKNLDRSATILYGKGGYSKKERPVLLCAVRIQQIYRLKMIVREIDPKAFLIVTDATEVVGEGFKHISI